MSGVRKTIVFVHHGTGMGGAPQLLLRLMQRLDPARYAPVVWCIRASSASALFEQHGFRVVYEPHVTPFLHISDGFYGVRHPHRVLKMLWGQFASFHTARRMFAALKPAAIHINSIVLPGVLCAAARVGCPVLVNVLECLHPGYLGLRRALLCWLTKRWGNYFVFMLPSEARRWGLANAANTVAVFDFIDLTPYQRPARATPLRDRTAVPPGTPLLGYFGRFTPAKGVHVLVRALGLLARRGVAFHAFLVGPVPAVPPWRGLLRRTPYINRLRALIAAEDVQAHVTFTDEFTEVDDAVRECEVLVVPFIEPHFSRLCAEAAAAGRPAVAFAIDGPGEEILDRQTGLLVKPFDAADLADKLAELLTNPSLRAALGTTAKAHASNVFDAERNMQQVLRLYDRALGA
jgi:glycosyltransferase involved in cell wall biosynthesis